MVGGDDLQQAFAAFARTEIDSAKAENAAILGAVPRVRIFVDGHEGAALESVRANGVVVAEFELMGEVLVYIHQQLVQHSPVKSGRYQHSHVLFADGAQVEPGLGAPVASEYVFVNTQPYARKLEKGASSEAPNGVYQAVAAMAKQRFSRLARITFDYRAIIKNTTKRSSRNPAISVRPNR